MKQTLMIVTIFTGALAQLFLPPWTLFGGAKAPVLASFALYYALHRSWRGMWVAVFWAALLHDGLDPGAFGPALLAFPIIGILAHSIRSEIFVDGVITQMTCGAIGGVLATFITVLVYAVSGERPLHAGHVTLRLIGSGLLGMVTLPLVSWAISTLEGALPKPKEYGWQ